MASVLKWIVSILVLAAIIATNFLYRDILFNLSLEFIPVIQQNADRTETNFWLYYSDVAYIVINYPVIALFYLILDQRFRSFYYLLAWTGNGFLMNLAKLSYHGPRPFWVGNDVMAIYCSSQFGNPSGHAMVTLGRPLLMWLDYQVSCKQGFYSQPLLKLLFFVIAIVYGLSVGYSRMFLGVHSLDQVIMGYLLGVWYTLTLHFCVREDL